MKTFTFLQFLHFILDVVYVGVSTAWDVWEEFLQLCWDNPATAMVLFMGCVVAFVVTCVRLVMWVKQWVKQYINEQVFGYMVKLVAQNILDEQIKPKKK